MNRMSQNQTSFQNDTRGSWDHFEKIRDDTEGNISLDELSCPESI